ncbi:hypothetical protein, partial [Pseudomonas sp. UBA1879]|uniref:hypothetical protein n=1 Tax=Pseudomonas sp. UBA1879 TaxID=1947305 RepID=UPI0025D020BF
SKTGARLYDCKGEGEQTCNGQYSAAKDGSARLGSLLDSFALTADEKAVLGHFQDINHNDERVAGHAWLQSFWSESGIAGGILGGGAAALAAAERTVAAEASMGVGAKGEVSGLLPKPGATSIPASGVGAGAAFRVDSKQLGKKLGKHVEDFGGNAASPADRKMVLDKIHDVGSNPEKVVPGTFAGQGANGARGDVFFRVKGNDVVVTKPDGTFVTILKDGVTQNPSVQSALKGGVR